jgi:hypothetical protein
MTMIYGGVTESWLTTVVADPPNMEVSVREVPLGAFIAMMSPTGRQQCVVDPIAARTLARRLNAAADGAIVDVVAT